MKNNNLNIIAEIGVNHNGSTLLAKKLIAKAKEIGIYYVKLQAFKAESIVTPNAKKAKYQNDHTKQSQYKMLKKLELNSEQLTDIYHFSKKINMKLIFSVFDDESFDLILKFKPNIIKIPSGEITNYPLLKKIAKLNIETLLSTGCSSLKEIKKTYKFLNKNGLSYSKIVVMQCTSAYPTTLKYLNINVLNTYKKNFKRIGFSDHSLHFEPAIVAQALGSEYIEKHFTLSNKMKGPDHKASLDFKNFKLFNQSLLNAKLCMGNEEKNVTQIEKNNLNIIRKKIVAKTIIKIGESFNHNNITTKRSNNGVCSSKFFEIIGKKSNKIYKPNQPIKF